MYKDLVKDLSVNNRLMDVNVQKSGCQNHIYPKITNCIMLFSVSQFNAAKKQINVSGFEIVSDSVCL
jgi:hypothetical protein